ncbi:MAG: hypothetical protein OEZ06_14370 [Myxococcales bacterium]|nr:hypothetical protein [Myxococcales bacterium]
MAASKGRAAALALPAPAGLLLLALLLGLVLRLPMFSAGARSDDYVHHAMLQGRFAIERAPWDLYWFGGASETEQAALRNTGYLPWWSHPEHRVAMLRPLPSLLLALDDALFGVEGVGRHVHSTLWWALLLVAAAALLYRVLPPRLAALALVFYAIDEVHGFPLAWVANRSTLVATALATAALWAHVRRRQTGAPSGGALASVLLALALTAGEYALCALPYFFAFELCRRDESRTTRLRALAPMLLLTSTYAIVRSALGYGTHASGLYMSPLGQPLDFLQSALPRMGAIMADLTLGVPAAWYNGGSPLRTLVLSLELFDVETWQRLPSWRSSHAAIGLLGAALLVSAYFKLLPKSASAARTPEAREPARADALRWLVLGAVGSLPIAAGPLPSSRLLCAAGLGMAALYAFLLLQALDALRAPAATAATRRRWLILAIALVGVHGCGAALRSHGYAAMVAEGANAERKLALDWPLPASREQCAKTDTALVSASDFATAAHLPLIRAAHGACVPRSYQRLSGAPLPHYLLGVDDHSLEVQVIGSDLSAGFAGSLYRPASARFRVGERFELPSMAVEITAVRDGQPTRFRVRFEKRLDDPALQLLQAGREGLLPIAPPAPGERVLVPRATPAWEMRPYRASAPDATTAPP